MYRDCWADGSDFLRNKGHRKSVLTQRLLEEDIGLHRQTAFGVRLG